MSDAYPTFIAAAVQAAPVFLDRDATVEKACRLITEAATNGARLIVFPEAWIPTFPYWPRGTNPMEPSAKESLRAHVALLKQAVDIPSAATQRLCEAARQADVYVMIGVNERDALSGGTLYNTQLYIDRTGKILGKHRKLVPTGSERVVWGQGDGSDLRVFATDCGRIGGLICFENFMLLSRAALLAQGQQIHVTHFPGAAPADFDLQKTSISIVFCRHYAFEGQVFVINAMGYLTLDMVPDAFPLKPVMDLLYARGGSVIVSPTGKFLAGPVYDVETILYAEINLEEILEAKARLDIVGHYARWDVTRLFVNPEHYGPFISSVPPETPPREPRWMREEQTDGQQSGAVNPRENPNQCPEKDSH